VVRQLRASHATADTNGVLRLIARYPHQTQEARISPYDNPCGAFVAGKFLAVRWPSPDVAVLDVEGKAIEVPKRASMEITIVGVRVQVLHS
jgi:hypothetical protein